MAICKQCLEFFEPDDYEIAEDRQEDICPTCKYLTPEVSTDIEDAEPIVPDSVIDEDALDPGDEEDVDLTDNEPDREE